MKKIVSILTILSVLLITQGNLQAQHPFAGPPHRGPALEKFAEELGITEAQKAELKAVHETNRSEVKALMEKEFESPEAHREAMKTLRDSQQDAVEAILTEAQLKKLSTLQEEEKAEREAQREVNKKQHKAMREEIQTYRETEILPVMRQQRAKLETQLSAEDKATISALRAKRAAHMQARPKPATDEGKRAQRPEWTEAQKAEMKADHEKIKALVNKYDSQITNLLAEIEQERTSWREDTHGIMEKYAPEDAKNRALRNRPDRMKGTEPGAGEKHMEKPDKEMGEHPHRGRMGRADMGKTGFLLLDASAETPPALTNKSDFAELRVFPNPSSSRNSVSYQLKEAGHYRVELRDKDGLVLQVLSNEYRQAGDYREELDLSAYAAGTYYVSIVGAEGVVSKKVVIAK